MCFALHTALMAGSHVIMLDSFSAEQVIGVLSKKEGEYVCTLFMAVPSMYGKMMDSVGEKKLDFEHMRLWTSGSAPLMVKDFETICLHGVPIVANIGVDKGIFILPAPLVKRIGDPFFIICF